MFIFIFIFLSTEGSSSRWFVRVSPSAFVIHFFVSMVVVVSICVYFLFGLFSFHVSRRRRRRRRRRPMQIETTASFVRHASHRFFHSILFQQAGRQSLLSYSRTVVVRIKDDNVSQLRIAISGRADLDYAQCSVDWMNDLDCVCAPQMANYFTLVSLRVGAASHEKKRQKCDDQVSLFSSSSSSSAFILMRCALLFLLLLLKK